MRQQFRLTFLVNCSWIHDCCCRENFPLSGVVESHSVYEAVADACAVTSCDVVGVLAEPNHPQRQARSKSLDCRHRSDRNSRQTSYRRLPPTESYRPTKQTNRRRSSRSSAETFELKFNSTMRHQKSLFLGFTRSRSSKCKKK